MEIHRETKSASRQQQGATIVIWTFWRPPPRTRDRDLIEAWRTLLKLQGKTASDSGRVVVDDDTGEIIFRPSPAVGGWKASGE